MIRREPQQINTIKILALLLFDFKNYILLKAKLQESICNLVVEIKTYLTKKIIVETLIVLRLSFIYYLPVVLISLKSICKY